jgi:hypothetical protein
VLTEVYRVTPTLPLQTYRLDKWTAGGHLTWPSQGFYRRRPGTSLSKVSSIFQ